LSALQPVRGTRDILPEEMRRHRVVIETARAVAARYGYEEMATPLFEFTEVFSRTLGETSDIVTKEMYTFAMKDGEQLTLRPEATAGIMRALISGGLSQQLPLKFFFAGPMFRYERPQKGRQRQFHQIDIELLGVASPWARESWKRSGLAPRPPWSSTAWAIRTAAPPTAAFWSTTSAITGSGCPTIAAPGWIAIPCAFSIPRTGAIRS
jgi:hypothetical protein